MKNLTEYKKDQKRRTHANRVAKEYSIACMVIDHLVSPIFKRSDERWAAMLDELGQKHWELDLKLDPQDHPPEVVGIY